MVVEASRLYLILTENPDYTYTIRTLMEEYRDRFEYIAASEFMKVWKFLKEHFTLTYIEKNSDKTFTRKFYKIFT